MTKAELIFPLLQQRVTQRRTLKKLFRDVFSCITETLEKGEKVSVSNFGVFDVRERAEKKVINPQTKSP